MASLRKNVAGQNIPFQLTDKSTGDPVTAGGAGNVTIDNGSQAACAGTFTHKGGGQWNYAPTQAETNGTSIGFQFTGTNAITIGVSFFTDNWDTTQSVITSGTGTNQLSVTGGAVASVSGLNASLLDVGISTRLAAGSYTAPNNAGIAAIKAQTDQLTFTVPNYLDVNIRRVNSIQVTGTGVDPTDPWGPV